MTIYHNPRCKKSKETLQLLRDNGIEPEIIEYLNTPPDKETLKELLTKLDMNTKAIIRKQEKEFKDHYKGKDLSEEDYLDAITIHPGLPERPIVVDDDKAVIKRPPENVQELLA
ncbi:MAG: arsenate reductase (glutaredoxin) [Bacteroidetes bacterium SW_11_45_7]|nr:MAG: arsenate reductase (glutaredoxin) [Bacteroidetes bacterium SW_11_45_7]